MIITATRRVQFAIGHRVVGHESKCRHLHGHNYVFHLTASSEELDFVGRVIDFSVLKERIGGWIEDQWDHGFVLKNDDLAGRASMAAFSKIEGVRQKVYYMPDNPTAENMADWIMRQVAPGCLADTNVKLVKVRVEETENCSAEVTL